ncbi:VWA domain-containing protein [candidate division WOR-3 bacterium]|nr:VWA domain-containing protein [candidate division WOR-3 bacterium]
MIFTRPIFLYLIPAVVLLSVILQTINLIKKKKLVGRLLATGHKSRLSLSDLRVEIVKESLIALALTSFLFAAAGPANESEISSLTKKGIDIIFLCDISRSMEASQPVKKIEIAKKIMTGIIERRTDDRISLVLFSGSATIASPLTFDHRSLRNSIKQLSTRATTSTGTSFLGAFTAVERVIEKEASRSTVVVLLSDGEDFGPEISNELDCLSGKGIPVVSAGIGSVKGDPVPEINFEGEIEGYIMLSSYDTAKTYLEEENLMSISDKTGGVYLRAENPSRTAEEIARFLETVRKQAITQKQDAMYVYHYEIPLAIGAVLIALSVTVEKKRRSSKWYF